MLSALRFIAVLAVALGGFAPRAAACGPSPCREAWARPSEGATVAPNLVTIEYEPGSDLTKQGSGLEAERVGTFELLSEDGETIPVSASSAPGPSTLYWLQPMRPLETNRSYRMRFERPCGEGAEWIEQRFRTGDMAEAPAQLGSQPRVAREQGKHLVPTSTGSCTTEITADVARIELDLAPGWRSLMPFTRVRVLVDGEAWAELAPSDVSAPLSTEVLAGCEVSDKGAYGFVAPGAHKVELSAQIAGKAEPLATVEVEVDLPCKGASSAKASAGGAQADAAGSGAASGRSGDCSVVSARAPAGIWLGGMSLVLLTLSRRVRVKRCFRCCESTRFRSRRCR